MRPYERADLREFLGSILDRVGLDPSAATLQVCYRIPLRSVLKSGIAAQSATAARRRRDSTGTG